MVKKLAVRPKLKPTETTKPSAAAKAKRKTAKAAKAQRPGAAIKAAPGKYDFAFRGKKYSNFRIGDLIRPDPYDEQQAVTGWFSFKIGREECAIAIYSLYRCGFYFDYSDFSHSELYAAVVDEAFQVGDRQLGLEIACNVFPKLKRALDGLSSKVNLKTYVFGDDD